MSIPVEELAELSGEDLKPQVIAILDAIRLVEEAELVFRARVRASLKLNSSDLQALRYIYRSERRDTPARPRDLGRRLAVTSAAATNIADRLCRAELVEKRPDPNDGRGRILVVSDKAREKLDDAGGDTQRRLNKVLGGISEDRAEYIVSLLNEVTEALGNPS